MYGFTKVDSELSIFGLQNPFDISQLTLSLAIATLERYQICLKPFLQTKAQKLTFSTAETMFQFVTDEKIVNALVYQEIYVNGTPVYEKVGKIVTVPVKNSDGTQTDTTCFDVTLKSTGFAGQATEPNP